MPSSALNRQFACWLAAYLALHVWFLWASSFGAEFAFFEGVRGLLDRSDRRPLDYYWLYQANPLGYSLTAAALCRLLHLPLEFTSVRLPALGGGAAILAAGWVWFRTSMPQKSHLFSLWAAATIFSPLLWAYSARATADVLSVGLLSLAFAVAWNAKGRWYLHALASALFAWAALVKFNVLLAGLGFWAIIWLTSDMNLLGLDKRGGRLSRALSALLYVVVPGVALAIYFAWIQRAFGIRVTGEGFRSMHNPTRWALDSPLIFTMYCTYLVGMLGFMAALPVLSRVDAWGWKRTLVIGAAAIMLAAILAPAMIRFGIGEMNYGFVELLLPKPFFGALRVVGVAIAIFFLADLIWQAIVERNPTAVWLICVLIPTIAGSSMSRPAQRYLLPLWPIVLFYVICTSRRERWVSRLGWSSVAVFAAISVASEFYTASHSRAALAMTDWIREHGYEEQTDPGAMLEFVFPEFPQGYRPAAPWTVTTTDAPGVIHSEAITVLGRAMRRYYLAPRPQPR